MVAQRRKPKSLTAQLDDLDVDEPVNTTILDDFESKLITKQVVHSFPDDKYAIDINQKEKILTTEVEECINKYKQQIPAVISEEPIEESSPIFRPKTRIVLKKKKAISSDDRSSASTHVLTSTPTKSGSFVAPNHSLDLFSDNSLLQEDDEGSEGSLPLCADYDRYVVIDCSVG